MKGLTALCLVGGTCIAFGASCRSLPRATCWAGSLPAMGAGHLAMSVSPRSRTISTPSVQRHDPVLHIPPPSPHSSPSAHHHTAPGIHAPGSVNNPSLRMGASPSKLPGLRLPSETPEWKRLVKHAEDIRGVHLRDLIKDAARCQKLVAEHDGIFMDYCRQQVTGETMKLLLDLARRMNLEEKIQAMARGEKINYTEGRSVLHMATRAARGDRIMVDGVNIVDEVHSVLDQIKHFSEEVRSGRLRGYTGRPIRNIVAIGIGGSYLGPSCIHEVFKTEAEGSKSCRDFKLRFLSNVDPVDVARAKRSLDAEETLVIIVSKSFTTAETMLNARTMRQWLWDNLGTHPDVVAKHMAACASTSAGQLVQEFGIPQDRLFAFWDWVGGRYSVCASPGALPISLKFGFSVFEKFLAGARSVDRHFTAAPLEANIPVLMGLLGVWNMSFLGYKCRTIIPYAEALMKFPAHIQQVDMESNGKHTTVDGLEVKYEVGEIDFGEPGSNGQHSFFQLLHMGQIVPVDFVGFIESQVDLHVKGQDLSSHDELMCNFFAQPDALAIGKTAHELLAEGVPPELIPHRTFKGNRPSLSLLFPRLTAYTTGQLLALYEHRTAVQGFVWHINSFDQWGVELGKQLASSIRRDMKAARSGLQPDMTGLVSSTANMLRRYWSAQKAAAAAFSPGGGDLAGHSI